MPDKLMSNTIAAPASAESILTKSSVLVVASVASITKAEPARLVPVVTLNASPVEAEALPKTTSKILPVYTPVTSISKSGLAVAPVFVTSMSINVPPIVSPAPSNITSINGCVLVTAQASNRIAVAATPRFISMLMTLPVAATSTPTSKTLPAYTPVARVMSIRGLEVAPELLTSISINVPPAPVPSPSKISSITGCVRVPAPESILKAVAARPASKSMFITLLVAAAPNATSKIAPVYTPVTSISINGEAEAPDIVISAFKNVPPAPEPNVPSKVTKTASTVLAPAKSSVSAL